MYFRYRGNKVPSGLNFNDTIKLPDLEPLFGARLLAVYVILAKLNQFCVIFPVFHYHGNRGPSSLNFNDTIKLPDLENPLFGAICSHFCVQKLSVGCHGNMGPYETNFIDTIRLLDPENPLVGARILAVSVIFVELYDLISDEEYSLILNEYEKCNVMKEEVRTKAKKALRETEDMI